MSTDALERVGADVLVRGWLSANSIVFRGTARAAATVVDTGYATHAEQTEALIGRLLDGAPLGSIVNTHLHSDHCGGNAALKSAWPGAQIIAPHGYRATIDPWSDSQLSYLETGQYCPVFGADSFLRAGATIELGERFWEAHAAPGHDPDALMFFEPIERVLISGDALWEHRLAIIFPELVGQDGFGPAMQTLDVIDRLKPRVVLPGHGMPFSNVRAALNRSRRLIAQLSAAPDRHRAHSARALAMFHMLEARRMPRLELAEWMAATPVFARALSNSERPSLLEAAMDTVTGLIGDRLLYCSSDGMLQIPDSSE